MKDRIAKYYSKYLLFILSAISIALVFLAYEQYKINSNLKEESMEGSRLLNLLSQKYNELTKGLNRKIKGLEDENINLSEALQRERDKNAYFEGQIKNIQGAVGILEKLSKTDEELLQKYSKIYFLNENYIPENLTIIPKEYLWNADSEQELHSKVLPYFQNLMEAAKRDGKPLRVISSYRSFGTQSLLKSAYKISYGAGANQFSADQGYSEHQLGTTVDFTTADTGANFAKFETTDAYLWLRENAYKYGFILSYPKDNAYYVFEPWHWRFVGIKLATKLHDEGKYFYEMDQREINQYLVTIFD